MKRVLLGACLLALAGCGERALDIQGKVTFNGKAVENGTIVFESEDGKSPTKGSDITNGTYRLTGANKVTAGPKIVRIQAFGTTGKKIPNAPGSSTLVDEMKQYIPAQYNTSSTLKVTVEAGKENTLDFDLKP